MKYNNINNSENNEEKRKKLYNKIDLNTYHESELEDQLNVLNLLFQIIVEMKEDGENIEDTKNKIEGYMYNILEDLIEPSIGTFYKTKTINYITKNRKDLEQHINEFLKNKKDYTSISKEDYTENINKNIETLIADGLNAITKIDYSKSEKFNSFREKVLENKMTVDDTKIVTYYIQKILDDILNEKGWNISKDDPVLLYNQIIDNLDNIFEVETYEINRNINSNSNYTIQSDDSVKIEDIQNILGMNEKKVNLSDASKENVKFKKIKIKKFVENPFMGNDKGNNALIFAQEFFSHANPEYIERFYEILKESKQNKKIKQLIIKTMVKIEIKPAKVKGLMSDRVKKLVKIYSETGFLEKFNNKNNNRLINNRLNGLTVDLEKLKSILITSNNTESFEAITAMSAFYTNRLVKVLRFYTRPYFIFNKTKAFEYVYENDNPKFKDLKLSEEDLSLYMSEYDVLEDILYKEYYQKLSEDDKKKISEGNSNHAATKRLFVAVCKQYARPYNEKYGAFTSDIGNVAKNSAIIEHFYKLKDFAMKSLIYTGVTSTQKSLINWGYVPNDTISVYDNEKILIGFDIKSLNMPVFLHMKRSELKELLYKTTGKYEIQVYEGGQDMNSLQSTSKMTTQILYPINKEQRKYLDKIARSNFFLEHLRWLQDSKKKPKYLPDPGSRIYDLEKNEIILKNKKLDNQEQNSEI